MSKADFPTSAATAAGWPKAAASAVVLRRDSVLLAERGKGPRAGTWSLPGGHIEPGETAKAAAIREVFEETGIAVDVIGLADVHDVILRDPDGRLSAHYLLAVYYGDAGPGEPLAASDCRTARFVAINDIANYQLTPGAEHVIRHALHLRSLASPDSSKRTAAEDRV